jgi:hypothetical protein
VSKGTRFSIPDDRGEIARRREALQFLRFGNAYNDAWRIKPQTLCRALKRGKKHFELYRSSEGQANLGHYKYPSRADISSEATTLMRRRLFIVPSENHWNAQQEANRFSAFHVGSDQFSFNTPPRSTSGQYLCKTLYCRGRCAL